jgi:signal transduction histidine kinase
MPADDGPGKQLLEIARRGASRMRQLIEDLLAFAAVGQVSGEVTAVDLDDLLLQVLADLEELTAEHGVTVERGALPIVRGHRALLGQLLQNLLANAIKFSRPGTRALVRVEADRRGDDGVTVSVVDNGIGIDRAHRTEVFGVFTRLNSDESSPGSGIGLATCAKVVHHHGGRIWVDDGIDGGTAVRVWLPDTPVAG